MKFERATEVLSCLRKDYFHGTTSIHERMAVAKAKDKSSSTILNTLKERFCVRKDLPRLYDRIILIVNSSQWKDNGREPSGFLSTSRFWMQAPPS